MTTIKKNFKNLNKIIAALKNGAVLVCPTDTVYGLVCDAKNRKAVESVFKIKKRSKTKTLPIFVKNMKIAKDLAKISKGQEKIIKKSWPGPTTFILKANSKSFVYNHKLLTKKKTVALRVPKYNFLLKILEKFGKPLAQTSANVSGKPATTKIKEVLEQFKNKDILIIDAGNLAHRNPSKIVDLTNGGEKVLRY